MLSVTCITALPYNCKIGETYGQVTFPNGSEYSACLCPFGRSCSESASDCALGYYTGSVCGTPDLPTYCNATWFYRPTCDTCACNITSDDFRWVQNQSAWVDTRFDNFSNNALLSNSLRELSPPVCPSLSSSAWDTRTPYCYVQFVCAIFCKTFCFFVCRLSFVLAFRFYCVSIFKL